MLAFARCAIASTRAPPSPLRQNSNVAARRMDSLVRAESRARLPRVALRAGPAGAVMSVTGQTLSVMSAHPRGSIRFPSAGGIEIEIATTRQGTWLLLHPYGLRTAVTIV